MDGKDKLDEKNLKLADNEEKKLKKKLKLKKKNMSIIGFCFIGFIVLFAIFYFFFVPKINLEGAKNIEIEYGDDYEELGYTASYLGENITDKVWLEGEVDTNKLGTYTIKYKVRKNKIVVTRERKITVIDSKAPVITLADDSLINVCPNDEYEKTEYSAVDNYDGDITSKVQIEEKDGKIVYSVADSSGNIGKAYREINRIDKEKPNITLMGGENIYLQVGTNYVDPGYSAIDNCDGDLTKDVTVSGTVDNKTKGKYTITYKVKDRSGNEAIKERIVTVTEEVVTNEPIKGAIYLTFDDGPSGSITPKLLDILKEKDVKATFFVINHSSNLDYLIKREYEEGHTVGLHSMSHNYQTVYSSVDAYFDDLQQISDKVERITGQKSNIIRFPGGGSNTVSKNYSKGIMTILTNEVLNRGYHYFDWNVSSGDAGDVKTKEEVYNNVINGLSKNKANIVLMHDFESNYKTLNAISDIIDYGKANGYQFLTIDMSTAMVRHKVNN